MHPSPNDVYEIILSAYYCCNNVDRSIEENTDETAASAHYKLFCLDNDLLHGLRGMLQPDEYMLLLQWILEKGSSHSLTVFLRDPPPVRLQPPTWKLLDLLEANQAHMNRIDALLNLRKDYPLSASELLSAMERFSHHWYIKLKLCTHATTSSPTSAEMLGALQDACCSGVPDHELSLRHLPSAQALSAEELVPIMIAAAAADNSDAVTSLFTLPAAQHMTPASASALLMSAMSASDGRCVPEPCYCPSAQQHSVQDLPAVTGATCWGTRGRAGLVYCLCSLPAVQRFSPMDLAGLLQAAIESACNGTAIWTLCMLCNLPAAKKLGAAQAQGLLAAAEDGAAAMTQLHGNVLAQMGLRCIWDLPAVRRIRNEA
jgi:hypothetical protein